MRSSSPCTLCSSADRASARFFCDRLSAASSAFLVIASAILSLSTLSRWQASTNVTAPTQARNALGAIAVVLGALSEARALVEEYARATDDPDTTDSDHRALAADIGDALDLAKRAAERSDALVRSADMELHLAGDARSEVRRRVEP